PACRQGGGCAYQLSFRGSQETGRRDVRAEAGEAGEAGGPGSGAVIRSAGIFRNTAHTQKKDRTEYAIHAKTFRQAG
ncbi:hypothetical protein, partial [Bacteroides fragilis]|uniref:hypothetical protein n=1 Tax=Bacteroides fragilis TaxID=817 RepID=UPI001EFA0F64